jgi:hypothetical protein
MPRNVSAAWAQVNQNVLFKELRFVGEGLRGQAIRRKEIFPRDHLWPMFG